MTRKRTIAVLFGGQSNEHEVSLVSAQAVMAALNREKYDVLPIGITKDGRWIVGPGALPALLSAADAQLLPGGVEEQTTAMSAQPQHSDNAPTAMIETQTPFAALHPATPIDVVFPVLHGPMGEDGTIQGLLTLAGAPYVGCGVAASAAGMDKALARSLFAAAGLPVLPWKLIRRHEWQQNPQDVYRQIEASLRYPVFVKPANLGSSVGISKAEDRAGLATAFNEAVRYDRRIVVEQGIDAREIEVSVLGNDEPEASLPGEVVPSGEWYDYTAKYLSGASEIIIPAPIAPELAAHVQSLALRAFAAIDGAGLARVDFLLDKHSGEIWINEVNTMPGFTSISMYAKMWAASGLSYSDLLDQLIDLALEQR